jgi:hypothetical protein
VNQSTTTNDELAFVPMRKKKKKKTEKQRFRKKIRIKETTLTKQKYLFNLIPL